MRYPARLMAVSTGDEVIKGKSNYICCKGAAGTLPLSSRRETPLSMRWFVISQQLRGFKRGRGLDFFKPVTTRATCSRGHFGSLEFLIFQRL